MPKLPTHKLNVVLLKSVCKSFVDALKEDHSLVASKLKSQIGDGSALYVKAPDTNPPTWQKFLQPVASGNLALANASSSAILFVQSDNRILAYCFGHGRTELRPELIENGFGRKVALNRVHPLKLRSIDARTLENGVTTKRMQTSRDSDQKAFGLDATRDLMRQVVGQPDDETFGTRVVGSDSLTLHASVTAGGLGAKSHQIIEAYKDDKYKANFEWVDYLVEVTDPKLRAELDDELVNAFASHDLENMQLAASSIVDWENVDKFKITGTRGATFVDLDIELYAEKLGANLEPVFNCLRA
jgi:uncharacterized protein (TIGR04141 family)